MASALSIAMASASPSASIDIPKRDVSQASFSAMPKHGMGLLTPPNSISPHMPAHAANHLKSPPLLNIVEEENDPLEGQPPSPPQDALVGASAPLSVGALSGLDARAAITPALLAKDFLPAIMLGNGPQPIRHVMGELTHTVPGFSRIPPAKARRLVVAALEYRNGGGQDGNIAFNKTGWGRWDAQVKNNREDSMSDDNFVPGMSVPANFSRPAAMSGREGLSASYNGRSGEWQYERDEDLDMDMDAPEDEADKMSLDERALSSSEDDDDDATDDEDWAAVGPMALRKASLPAPGQPAPPRTNYQALGVPISRPSYSSWSRRFSAVSERSIHSAAVSSYSPYLGPMQVQTPEEQVAIEALLKMGSI